jgi:hypothetical protein
MPERWNLGRFMEAVRARRNEEGKPVWILRTKKHGGILGEAKWFLPWRCFVFEPAEQTAFSHDCLAAIVAFLQDLNLEEPRGSSKGKDHA